MKNTMPRFERKEFANIVDLAKNKTFFCITHCERKMQQNGVEKWYLTIKYYKTSEQRVVFEWLTFFATLKDGRVNRKNEKLFQPMLDTANMPIHNAFITATDREYFDGHEKVLTTNYDVDWMLDTVDLCSCSDDEETAA